LYYFCLINYFFGFFYLYSFKLNNFYNSYTSYVFLLNIIFSNFLLIMLFFLFFFANNNKKILNILLFFIFIVFSRKTKLYTLNFFRKFKKSEVTFDLIDGLIQFHPVVFYLSVIFFLGFFLKKNLKILKLNLFLLKKSFFFLPIISLTSGGY